MLRIVVPVVLAIVAMDAAFRIRRAALTTCTPEVAERGLAEMQAIRTKALPLFSSALVFGALAPWIHPRLAGPGRLACGAVILASILVQSIRIHRLLATLAQDEPRSQGRLRLALAVEWIGSIGPVVLALVWTLRR